MNNSTENKIKIDDKDRLILAELTKNSNLTTGKLSRKLKIPVTTVHNRIKKLEKAGVIMNYTVNLNWKILGRPIPVYIGVVINYNVNGKTINQSEVAKQIKKIEGVDEVYIMTGGSDILVKVLAKDIDDLNEIVTEQLRAIPGIDKTSTAIVLQEV